MTNVQKYLFSLQDKKYKEFQSNLIPNIKPETVIGVRVPLLRKYAKELWKGQSHLEVNINQFLKTLPHEFYEENLLHGFLLEFEKDFEKAVRAEDKFLLFIDNWAVCDTTNPKVFKNHTSELFPWVQKWISSEHEYTRRYGIGCLMRYYLDENFDEKYLKLVSEVWDDGCNFKEGYYVNMMIAWYFATALAKQWDCTIKYIEQNCLNKWTHNKAIQKALESFRVTPEHKEYLKTLKIK